MAIKHASLAMGSPASFGSGRGRGSTLSVTSQRSQLAAEDQAVTAISGGLALDRISHDGPVASGGDVYYDAPDADFAQPALQAVMDNIGIQWLEDRAAQAQKEQAAHDRLCAYAAEHDRPEQWHRAAEIVTSAVGGGLTGAFNFGAYALLVAQVSAAMNHGPAGFGLHDAKNFSASAAGRQVLANVAGAVPGSIAYGVGGAISPTMLRPMVDAIALLLSAGRVTPVVPVDPALVFPTPSPFMARGRCKNGAAYAAELQANAAERAALAARQAAMQNIGDRFNLKYGTPLFAVAHALRMMYVTAQLLKGRTLGANFGAALSSASSGSANCGLLLLGTRERLATRLALTRTDGEGKTSALALPLFMPQRDLRRIRGEAEPALCASAAQIFTSAAKAYVADTGVVRKLGLGVPASALAIFGSTLILDTMVPLGTLAATSFMANDAGAILFSGVTTALAYALTYLCVGKSLAWCGQAIRRSLQEQHRQRLDAGFRAALENFQERYPQEVERIAGSPDGSWTVAQIAAIFERMHEVVLAGLDTAVAERRNEHLEPGADARLRAAYVEHAAQMRAMLVAADAAETTPEAVRNAAQRIVLTEVRQHLESISGQVQDALRQSATRLSLASLEKSRSEWL